MKKKMLPLLVNGFGVMFNSLRWIDAVKAAPSDIGDKVGCRMSAHRRWKQTRSLGYTKRRRA